MTGYWPSSFLRLSTETELRSMKSEKKSEADIQPSCPGTLGQ